MNEAQFVRLIQSQSIHWDPCGIISGVYNDLIPVPLLVLYKCCNSFKNRIQGTIIDNWLTKETFNPIAKECYEYLCKLEEMACLEDWQIELKTVFKNMSDTTEINNTNDFFINISI